jgi:type IV pilus assembly protein PilC
MAEFVIRLADERGRIQEQVQTGASAEEQFLTLIRAGLPILSSLQMLSKIQKNANFSGQLEDVAARVKTGEALSAAFEAQGGFPLMYTTTLLAGERAGNLQEVLDRYVGFQKVSLAFRKKLLTSLIYPCVLLTLVAALMVFLLTVVVPQFAKLYDEMGSKLPAMTIDLLNTGEWLQHNIAWLALAVLTIAALVYRCSISERGRDFVDSVRVGMPVFGMIWLKYQVALFARTLSTLLTGGLPLVPSLETAARSISSRKVSKAVFSSVGTVREGRNLADSLAATKVFPSLATEMITVGEQTGALPQMLNSVAEFFEEDVATALSAALSLVEPAILIIMGVVVVFILISLYLPIFSLGQAGGTM